MNLDVIFTMMAMTFATSLSEPVKRIFNWLIDVLGFYGIRIMEKLNMLRNRNYIDKIITVEYVTGKLREINKLYSAITWYLETKKENKRDSLLQTPLNYTYFKERRINEEKLVLNISTPDNYTQHIIFRGVKIEYKTRVSIITIRTDKERTKDNPTIELRLRVPKNETINYLDEFCNVCMCEWLSELSGKNKRRIWINKNGKWESELSTNTRQLNTIILRDGLMDDIKNDIDYFIKCEDFKVFAEKWGEKRKRGYLFYGNPGTGKSSLAQAIANYLDMDLAYFNGSNIKDDNELMDLFKTLDPKCILLMEDIDCMMDIVTKREEKTQNKMSSDKKNNMTELTNMLLAANLMNNTNTNNYNNSNNSKVTLSGLLNAIDGVYIENNNRILIMTSNKPKLLDDALIRSRRIDRRFKLDYSTHEQISSFYKAYFGINPDPESIRKIPEYKYSPASISSFFMRYKSNPHYVLKNITDIDKEDSFDDNPQNNSSDHKPEDIRLADLNELLLTIFQSDKSKNYTIVMIITEHLY